MGDYKLLESTIRNLERDNTQLKLQLKNGESDRTLLFTKSGNFRNKQYLIRNPGK